jgi:hypothetical protein
MGRTHFELSRSAEESLRAAMASAQPIVVRSALTSGDMVALIDEWDLFMAQDKSLYQMGEGRGMQTLSTMWNSPMRLEHDLRDTSTPNPVMTWLSSSPQGSVATRVWHLQQQLEGVAAAHRPVLRRPAFATGLVRSDGRDVITQGVGSAVRAHECVGDNTDFNLCHDALAPSALGTRAGSESQRVGV